MNDTGRVSSWLPATMKPRTDMALSTTGAPLDPGLTSALRDARLRTSSDRCDRGPADSFSDLSGADSGLAFRPRQRSEPRRPVELNQC